MNTLVYKIDLVVHQDDIPGEIARACDKQLSAGFKLASSFVWVTDLVLIFQKLP